MRSHHASRHATVLLTVVHILLYLLGLMANSPVIQLRMYLVVRFKVRYRSHGHTIFLLMVGKRPAYRHIRP